MILLATTNYAGLTLSEQILLGRLVVLTCNGKHPTIYTPSLANSELGLSRRTYFNAIANLSLYDLIRTEKNNCISISLTDKAIDECKKCTNECKNCTDTNLDKSNSYDKAVQNLHSECKKCTTENDVNQLLSCFDEKSGVYIYNIYNILLNNINNNKYKKEKEINKEKEKVSLSVKTTAKRITYPTCSFECEPYFEAFVTKHLNDFPQLANLNIPFEAEQFYNYWALEREWIDNSKKKVKSISGRVSTWLQNWCSRNKSFAPRTVQRMPSYDYSTVKRLPAFVGVQND